MRWSRLAALIGSAAAHVGAVGLGALALGISADSVFVVDLGEVAREDRPPQTPERPVSRRAEPPRAARAPRALSSGPRDVPTREVAASRHPGSTQPSPAPEPAPETRAPETTAAPPSPEPAPLSAPDSAPAPALPAVETAPPVPVTVPAPIVERAGPTADGARSPHAASDAPAGPPQSASRAAGTASGDSGIAGAGSLARAVPGEGRGDLPPEYGPYLGRFRKRVQEALAYPLAARRRGLAGSVEIEVLIDSSGAVASARVIASSSHAVLDAAALQAVRSVSPMPLPEHLPRRPLRLRLPLSFVLQ